MRKCLIAFLCGLLVSFQVSAQNKVIKGRVTDETSNPVPNASVVIKGAKAGALLMQVVIIAFQYRVQQPRLFSPL